VVRPAAAHVSSCASSPRCWPLTRRSPAGRSPSLDTRTREGSERQRRASLQRTEQARGGTAKQGGRRRGAPRARAAQPKRARSGGAPKACCCACACCCAFWQLVTHCSCESASMLQCAPRGQPARHACSGRVQQQGAHVPKNEAKLEAAAGIVAPATQQARPSAGRRRHGEKPAAGTQRCALQPPRQRRVQHSSHAQQPVGPSGQ
jgi:hypothetical protein